MALDRTALRITPLARLMFVVTSLVFAQEEKAGSVETRRKIAAALKSARADLKELQERQRLTRKTFI